VSEGYNLLRAFSYFFRRDTPGEENASNAVRARHLAEDLKDHVACTGFKVEMAPWRRYFVYDGWKRSAPWRLYFGDYLRRAAEAESHPAKPGGKSNYPYRARLSCSLWPIWPASEPSEIPSTGCRPNSWAALLSQQPGCFALASAAWGTRVVRSAKKRFACGFLLVRALDHVRKSFSLCCHKGQAMGISLRRVRCGLYKLTINPSR